MTSARPRFFSLFLIKRFLFTPIILLVFFLFTFSLTHANRLAEDVMSKCTELRPDIAPLRESTSKVFFCSDDRVTYTCYIPRTGDVTLKSLSCDVRSTRPGDTHSKDLAAASALGICGTEFTIANCVSTLADFIVGNLVKLINGILSWILSIAMYLLDLVIYITVVKFSDNFANLGLNIAPQVSESGAVGNFILGTGRGGLIYYIWGMLRDFVNLLLLVTIIYYAIHTMFQGFSAHKDKFLYLLIFSIVINFSLFFVKFAIDLSNILSLQAYTLMANPAGFENWTSFRQNASGGSQILVLQVAPKATLGDYLLNIASIGGVHKAGIGGAEAERRIHEGMKASWVYQVIVMLMYIGLIYIVFFLAGLLIMRAAAFLLAMLLAALLAADIFFSTFNKDDIQFADAIRTYTDKIRDDFYEALLKGPVLFLFLFLVGVLSNAIFNQSLQTEITSITNNSEEFKVFGTAFAASLAIFLKFAMFFALTKVLFEKLNEIKMFGDKGKSSWFGGGSKWISKQLLRPFSSAPGAIGRRFARGLDRDTYRGRAFQYLNSGFDRLNRGKKWSLDGEKEVENNSVFKNLYRNLGNYGQRAATATRKGSYEVTQSKAGQRLKNTELGKKIESIAGIFSPDSKQVWDGEKYVDKEISGGFESRDKAYQDIRDIEVARDTKVVESGQAVTQEQRDKAEQGSKMNIPGYGEISVKDFKQGKMALGKNATQQAAFKKFKAASYIPGTNANSAFRDAQERAYATAGNAAKATGLKSATEFKTLDNSTIVGDMTDRVRGSYVEANLRVRASQENGKILSNKNNVAASLSKVFSNVSNQYDEILSGYGIDAEIFKTFGRSLPLGSISNMQTPLEVSELKDEIKRGIAGASPELSAAFAKLTHPADGTKGLDPDVAEKILINRAVFNTFEEKITRDMIANKKTGVSVADAVARFESEPGFKSISETEISAAAEQLGGFHKDDELYKTLTENSQALRYKLGDIIDPRALSDMKAELESLDRSQALAAADILRKDQLETKIRKHYDTIRNNSEDRARLAALDALLKDKNVNRNSAEAISTDLGKFKEKHKEVFGG